jgi:predicted amidophosphoribosyltransferase
MWCCMRCNLNAHFCPGCGTESDHHNTPCPECDKPYGSEINIADLV